jgi:RNA polymerase sigma-70 factor (ECF subfamily)
MKMKNIDFESNPENWANLFADFLYCFAIAKVNCKEDAEDLIQETFLSAYKSYSKFEGRCSIKTWLTGILKNKIIDYYKCKNSKFHQHYSYDAEDFSFFRSDASGNRKNQINLQYVSESADQDLLRKEFDEIFDRCLQKLPLKLKTVFVARYIYEKNSDEICKEFNISQSNYWVVIFRAKTLLKSYLEKIES